MTALTNAVRNDFLRKLRNHNYELDDAGRLMRIGSAIPHGVFDVEHRRGGKLISRDLSPNLFTVQGFNHMLATEYGGGTAVNPWYIALFEGNVTPVDTWTAANFTANSTECTAYDETNRVTYVEGTPAAAALDNSANRAVFTMNASKTVYGGALISVATKSAPGGFLAAASRFSSPRAVVAADELAVKYSLSFSNAA